MKSIHLLAVFFSIGLLCSCTVTNSVYLNDPVPLPKGELTGHIGVGTGNKTKIDSVSDNGNIAFNDELQMAPIIFLGGQYGITNQLDLRFALHLPYAFGGFGVRGGIQYSFFPKHTLFNAAIGADIGGVYVKDSIKILKKKSEFDTYTDGALNADFFIPLSYSFNENYRIILTARYSFNTIYVRDNMYEKRTTTFKPQLPSVALGLKLNKVYIETSVGKFDDTYLTNFGISFIIDMDVGNE